MKVPIPLLFMLLMVLVIIAFYDILRKSYDVHSEANRRVARAVLESTLTRANSGLNGIASRLAMEGGSLDVNLPKIVFRNDGADVEDLAIRTLFLSFDSNHQMLRGRIGHNVLEPANLTDLASQAALPRLFKQRTVTNNLPNALLVVVNGVSFVLSDPQPLRDADRTDHAAFLVVGLPASDMVFDELQKYEVFGSGVLKAYLENKDDLSSLADLIVSLQDREYAEFHFSAVAQIFVLLVAFVIAVMIGRLVDEKNDALRVSRDVIADREREAQQLRELAEVANGAKSQFIHNMSHELRTPLNAILGYADIIKTESFGALEGPLDRYKESADAIHNGGLRLLNSISQVLEYSDLIDADGETRDENVDMAVLLLGVASEFQDRAEERKIILDVINSPGLPSLRADREMLRRLFSQLLANAIEFSEAGGSVTLSPGVTSDGQIRVAVIDHGKGMDSALQSHAFEAFVQGESVYARQHQGMGLGLSLADTYARYHGADIKVESTLGDGTIATVLFPSERSVLGVG